MDCFNYSCPFRVNQSSSLNRCECSYCPNRCDWTFSFTSNRTLTDSELAEMQRLKEGATMAEYIEREAAMDIVRQTYGNYSAAFPKLRKLPTADVAQVRHGRWERDEWGSYLRRRSVCKKPPVYQDERGNSVAVYAGLCINCGAIMEETNA